MAIQLDLSQSKYGVPFQGAYFRILISHVFRSRTTPNYFLVRIHVAGYAAHPASEDVLEIESRDYVPTVAEVEAMNGSNFIEKCYAWVMAQPDMAGSLAV